MPSQGSRHFDRFYSFDELPKKVQKDHKDWASGETQFVRYRYRNGRIEFIALESFMRHTKSPSGKKIDGFATDSYFSGTALRLTTQAEQHGSGRAQDMDYEVWSESW